MDITGQGRVSVAFSVDVTAVGDAVSVPAFVGLDFDTNVQHSNSMPLPGTPKSSVL